MNTLKRIWVCALALASFSLAGLLGNMDANAADIVTYYHNDIAGTPLLATDAAGNVLWKENYQPYGDKLNKQPASVSNKVGFAGKPYDGNTGLSYLGARYYDPVIGRFMGIDPKGFDEGNIQSFNRYAYANNNPYKFVDPDGNTPVHVLAFAIGFAIDAGVQHWGPEGRSWSQINLAEAAISGVGAAITGGVGGVLAKQALQGTISTTTAVFGTSLTGAAAGGTGSVAGDIVNGKDISLGKAALSAAGGALGAGIAGKVANAEATAIAKASALGGVEAHIANATRPSVNFGRAVVMGGSAAQAVGTTASDAAIQTTQKAIEQKAGL